MSQAKHILSQPQYVKTQLLLTRGSHTLKICFYLHLLSNTSLSINVIIITHGVDISVKC